MTSVEQASAAVEAARAAFLAAPTPELEQGVEDAERELRRAERFAEAEDTQKALRERESATSARAAAKEDLARLEVERGSQFSQLATLIDGIVAMYGELDATVQHIEALARNDRELVANILATARRAGDVRRTEALTATLVRDAVRTRLARDFVGPLATGDEPLPTFGVASGRVNSPGTRSQRHQRLRDASDAFVVDTGASELADWLTLFPPPDWEHLRARHAAAEELLSTLEFTETNDGQ